MSPKQFDRVARELFGTVLEPEGFTSQNSQRCTFHRRISEHIYHVVMPDPGTRCAWYDVKVFPTSPSLYDDFTEKFPDGIGIPLDVWCYLSDTAGIGMDQQQFNCKTEENMRLRFERSVRPLLLNTALPFLNGVRDLEGLRPLLRGPLARKSGA